MVGLKLRLAKVFRDLLVFQASLYIQFKLPAFNRKLVLITLICTVKNLTTRSLPTLFAGYCSSMYISTFANRA